MTEPRVEAGDRALETARKIADECTSLAVDSSGAYGDFVKQAAALIQSAMNAQERELREALGKVAAILQGCDLETDFYLDSQRPSQRYVKQQMLDWLAEAERLLAESGEGV